MGLITSAIDRFRVSPRVRKAADQFWDAIQRGYTFEVPFSLDANDEAMQAVWLLFRLHPNVPRIVRQSRGFVLTDPANIKASQQAHDFMWKGGQYAKPDLFLADVRKLIQGQADFLTQQGLDPTEQADEAKRAEQEKHALTVNKVEEPAAPAVTEPEPPKAS